jgi:dipeptidyl aminopeptidase/acylaminoacyl peptidase
MKTNVGKHWKVITIVLGLIFALALLWLATTDNLSIWPYRNTLQYYALSQWWQWRGYPQPGQAAMLQGVVRDEQGQPIAGAWVLASRWDGTAYSARSESDGAYAISDIPAGQYRPVAGAIGYSDVLLTGAWGWLTVNPGNDTMADVTLPPPPTITVVPGTNLTLSEPVTTTCPGPIEASARRQTISFDSAGRPSQPALYYTPVSATAASRLPTLLADYPGPVDTWECASLPLAAAGYAVVAVGPAYSLELEKDIDELARYVQFIRAGQFPGSDGSRLAILGGSYSGLHVQRLMQRDPHFEAAVLLGPPSDLFDMRRRLEDKTFVPPFGLDQVMVALGLPDREPLRYWKYSGAYHIRPDLPPLLIMHSRTDEVVPYQQSELFANNLNKVGLKVEVYFFDGASHYLLAEGGDKDTLEIYRLTLEFLAKHLQ